VEDCSRGRFPTPADFPLHDCSPYRGIVARTEGYTCAAKVWDFPLVQGLFPAAPFQILALRFVVHWFSLCAGDTSPQRRGGWHAGAVPASVELSAGRGDWLLAELAQHDSDDGSGSGSPSPEVVQRRPVSLMQHLTASSARVGGEAATSRAAAAAADITARLAQQVRGYIGSGNSQLSATSGASDHRAESKKS
jgi:hypothetical protein